MNGDSDEIIDKFLEDNEITFELRAINGDGEVLMKFTDHYAADNLSGDAWKIDEWIEQQALESEQTRLDDIAEAQMQDEMDRD